MERNNELSFSVRNSGDVASVQPASLRDGGNTPGYVGDLQLLAGEELDSRLQIFERIGGGSSARVYRGILDGSTPVAVKVLHPHAAQRDSTLQEFLREAQVLARLHHKHIIKLYALAHLPPNFGGLPTRRYTWGIVTEYMEAGTLTRLVQDASRALKLQHKARQAMAAAAANNNPPPERSGSLRAMKQSLSFLRRTMTPDAPPSPRTRGGGGAGGSSGVPGTPGAASRIPSTTAGGGGSIGHADYIHVPPLPYSDREALLWCMEVALALQFLHAQNPPVVHRDVKTDNVLMAIAPLGPAPNASPGPRLFGLESGFTSPGAAAAAAAALSGGIGDRAGGVGASHGGLARRVLSLQAAAAALGSESRGASLTITGRPGGGRPLTAKVADFGIHVVLDISRPVAGTRRRSFEEPPPGTIGVYSNTSLTRMSNRPSYTGGPGSGPMAGGGPSGYGGVMGGGGSLYGSGYGMAGGSGYGAYGHGSSTMHPMQHPSPAAGGRLDTRSRRSSTMSRANEEPMQLRRGISREGDSFTRITGGAGGGLPVVRKTSNLSHVDPPQGCSGDSPEPSGSQTAAAAAALGPDGPTSGRIDPRDRDSGVAASYAAYAAFGGQPRGAGGRGGAAGSGGRSPRGTGTGPGPPGYGGVHSGGSSKGFPMQPPGTGSVGTVAAARASLDLLLSGRMSATEAVAQACQSPSNPLSPGRGGGGVGGGFGPADPGSVQGVVVRASSHARSQSVAPPGGGSGGGVSSDGQVPMFGQTSNPNDRGSRLRTSGPGPGGGAGPGPAWERLPTGDLNPSGDQSLGAGGTQRLSNRSSSQRPSGHGEGRGGGHSGPVSGSGVDPRLLDARGPRASGSPGGAGTRTNTPLRSNAAQVAQYLAMMEEDLQLGFVSRTSSKAAGEMEHLSGPSSRQGSQSTQQGRSGAPSVVLGPAAGGGGGGGGGTGPGGGGSGTGGGLSNRSLLSAGPSQGALPSGASTPQMLQGGTSGSRLSPGPRMSRPSLMPGGAAGSGGGGVGGGAGGGGAGAGSGGRLAVVSNTSGHHLMMQLNAAVAANAAASGGGSSSSVSPRKATTSGTGVTAAAAAAAAAAVGGSNGGGPVAGGGARAGGAGVGAGSARGSATGGAGSGIADPVMRTASTASTHDSDHGMIVLTGSADGQLLANRHGGGAHGSSTAGTRNNTGSGVGSGSGVGTGPNAGPGPGPAPPSSRRYERDPGDHAPVAASGPAVAPGPIPGPAGPHPLPSKSSSHPVLSVTASELQLPGLGPGAPSGGLAQILPGIAGRNPNPLKASSQPTMNLGQGSGQVRTGRLPGHSLFGRQASSKGGDLGRRASATSGGSGSGPNGQPPAGVGANPPLSRTLSSGARALSNLGLTAGSAGDGRGDQELHPHGQRVIRAGSASAAASMLIRHPSESAPNAPGSASAANGGTSVSARWGSSRVEAAAEVPPSTGHSSRSRTSPFQQRRGMQIPDISVPLDPDPDLGDAGIEHLGVSHALTSPAPVPRTVPSPRAAFAAAGGGGGSAAAVVAALRADGAAGGAGGGGGGGAVGIVGVVDVVGSPRAGSASGPGTPSGVDGSTTPGGGGGGGTGNGGGRLWIATVTSAAASPRTGMPAVGGGLDGPDSALTSPASGSHAQHSAAHPPVNKELHKIVKRLRPSGGSFTGSGNSPLGLPPAGTGAGGAPSSGGGGRGGGSVRVSMGGSSAGGGGGRGGGGSFTCSRRSSIDSPAPSYGSIGSARSATAALPSGGAAAGGSGSATGAATTAAGGGIMAALHRERMLWGRGLGGAVGGSGPSAMSAMSVASSGPASPIGSAGGGTAGGGVTGGSSGMLGRPVSRAAASNLSAASVGVGPGAAAAGGGGGGAAVDPRAVSCSTAVGPPSGVPGLPRSGGSGSGARGSASGASAGRQSSAGNAGVTSTPQALGASGLMGPLPGGGSNPGIHPGGGGGPGSHLPAALASPMLAHVARAVSQASSSVAPRMVSESALSSTTMGGWTGRDELPLAGEAMYALTGRAGTVMYMAPEVIRDEPYNEKVDVFSFGVVLYEVFGRVLLLETYGKDELEALSARISNGYRHSRPECMPPAVWDIVQQCWAQNPADRPNMPLVVRQLELALEALNEADAASAAAAAGSMRPGSLFGTGPYSEGGGLVGTGSNAPGSPLMFGTAAAGSAGGSNTTITVGEKQRSSGKSLASHKSLLSLGSLGRRSKGISFRRRPSLPRAPPQPSAPTPGRAPPLPANYMLSIDVAGLPGGGAGNSGSLASPQSRGSVGAAGLPDSPHGPERERPPPRCAPCGCVIC